MKDANKTIIAIIILAIVLMFTPSCKKLNQPQIEYAKQGIVKLNS